MFSIVVLIVAPFLASAININGQFEPMNNIDGNKWYTKFVNKRNTENIVNTFNLYRLLK